MKAMSNAKSTGLASKSKTFQNHSKGTLKDDKTAEINGKIEQTDEMKLKLLATLEKEGLKLTPEDSLYPPELNAHLLEQLKVMTAENGHLRKVLFTKDEEIKELDKTVGELNIRIRDIISATGPAVSSKSAGVISAKIADLCKQNRHLIAEIETYKTKCSGLERKIMHLELLDKESEKLDSCLCKNDQGSESANPEEIKELNQKLASVNKRLCESKSKNIELKNEIIAATKILQHELGDKFTSLKELQNDVMGWKGRAEKIILLQARVKELEEMLKLREKDEKYAKKSDQDHVVKEIEAKRKREMEQALKDYHALKQENQDLKKKVDAAKCRIRNLECDSTTIRQKMQTFVEKSNADDQLINEQRAQIKNLELYYQEILKDNTVKMSKMHSEICEHQKTARNTEAKIDALRKQAAEKASKIEELRAQLLRYEECSLQSVFFTPMRTATDNEIQKLSQMVVTLNERLDKERQNWEELEASHRKLREKKKRLEKKLANLEEEVKSFQESRRGSKISKASYQKDEFGAPPGSRKTSLKTSLDAITEKPSETSTLETAIEPIESLDKEELRYKLILTEEKLKSLEDKLKMVVEEKQEDFNYLTEMIQTSKQLFNEALMVLQKEKCNCDPIP